LNHPKKWNQEVVRQWDALLEKFIPKASSRNRKRTALRRYFEFLYKKNLIKNIPLIVGESVVRETDETPIPGELPNWVMSLNGLETCLKVGIALSEP
jgi:site-specific recombinase XerD